MSLGPKIITTVNTAASTYDLTTLEIVQAILNVSNPSIGYLTFLISAASAAAAQYCNRVFPAETVTDEIWFERSRLSWNGQEILQLSRWPVVSITSVTEDGCLLVEDTDFLTDATNGQLIRLDANGRRRPWFRQPIIAVYEGGFTTIPFDLSDAAVRMVRARYFANLRDPMLRSENIEGVYEAQYWISAVGNNGNLTPDVLDILDNYRVPVVA